MASRENRESLGVMYEVVCSSCGHSIDDHLGNPFHDDMSDAEWEHFAKRRSSGYRKSLASCHSFRVKRSDVSSVITTTAKRMLHEEENVSDHFLVKNLEERAKKLLNEMKEKWEKESWNRYSGGSPPGYYLIVFDPKVGRSVVIDIGL